MERVIMERVITMSAPAHERRLIVVNSKMLESIRTAALLAPARVALFDFDGTLSLIRSGWIDVMIPMMVEILIELKTGESGSELRAIVDDFVGRLTGKETIYQMMEFADHVAKRGGTPLPAL